MQNACLVMPIVDMERGHCVRTKLLDAYDYLQKHYEGIPALYIRWYVQHAPY